MRPFGERINTCAQSKAAVNKKTLFKTSPFICYKAEGIFTVVSSARERVCACVCARVIGGGGEVLQINFFARVCPGKLFFL